MESNELSMHEWLGVLGAGLIAAAMIALALPAASDMNGRHGADQVAAQTQNPRSADRIANGQVDSRP